MIDQDKIDRFYKGVSDIQSLNRSDIDGNLADYFQHRFNEWHSIIWLKDPGTKIRNQVIAVANTFLI